MADTEAGGLNLDVGISRQQLIADQENMRRVHFVEQFSPMLMAAELAYARGLEITPHQLYQQWAVENAAKRAVQAANALHQALRPTLKPE